MPVQKRYIQLVFKRLDLAAKRGLGNIQPICGGREAAQTDNVNEVAKLAKIHLCLLGIEYITVWHFQHSAWFDIQQRTRLDRAESTRFSAPTVPGVVED
jgi:hypothetical protein